MSKSRLAQLGLVMAALGFTAAAPLLGLSSIAHAETLRAEVGNPLQAAQALMKAGKNREALAELKKADNVPGKTPHEAYLIERVRASAAGAAGDNDTLARSFETLLASGKLSPSETSQFSAGLVGIYMRARDYAKANAAIMRMPNHDDPTMRGYLIQNYFAMGNFPAATKELQTDLRNAEKSGARPSENQLQMMANLQLKANDKPGYVNTIEKLANFYPKPDYWTDLLNRESGKAGFSERLGIDISRLRLANGLFKKSTEYVDLAQMALQAKAPAEALKIIDKGYKAGVLGTGTEAARHERLKALADKNLAEQTKTAAATEAALLKAKDNDGLIDLGFGLVQAGQNDKGLQIMEAAIKADSLKHPEDAKLRLGHAYAIAGNKTKAVTTLKTVTGADGTADLARFWIMAISHNTL